MSIQDGAIPINFYTTARTVGEALFEKGITVYDGDRVFPSLSSGITPSLAVSIERAKPVMLAIDNVIKAIRTRIETIDELLQAENISLGPKDYVLPERSAAIVRDALISVVRVYEEHFVEETPIPFETRWEEDPEMDIDQYKVTQWGREGAKRQRIQVHYENNKETSRSEEEEWIARESLDRIIRYGTKITLRELETPDGIVTYWRKLRVLATSYNAPTAGKPRDHPTWGITRVGWRARMGIIAVDPRIINMLQEMYVPGYGKGVAADTGGAIKWRHIDLCYDDDNLVLWWKWVDVYLLTPVPDPEDIKWVIPNYPVEKE
jgi:3D (Asp-Asp-Asp) domain-containing protein